MSDTDEDAPPPLLNALSVTKLMHVLEEVGRATADELWNLHALKLWHTAADLPTAGSEDEAELVERTETHLLGVLEDNGLLLVNAAAANNDGGAALRRRLRAFVLALLRIGHRAAKLHVEARAVADALPSAQTDPEKSFAFPATVPETCEALVKDDLRCAIVHALGLGEAEPLRGFLASPMALRVSEAEVDEESEVDEGGDIGDSSDDDEDEDEDDGESDDASGEAEEEEEDAAAPGSPPPKRRKE